MHTLAQATPTAADIRSVVSLHEQVVLLHEQISSVAGLAGGDRRRVSHSPHFVKSISSPVCGLAFTTESSANVAQIWLIFVGFAMPRVSLHLAHEADD
jgi:hypothetical protein